MFSLFQNLPYELRHEIWRYHIPAPRVIETRYDGATGRVLPGSVPPILLHVCQESRRFLLSTEIGFTMQFGTSGNPAAVCINAKTDAVQIDYDALKYNHIKPAEFETIVRLELCGSSLYNEDSVDILRQLVKFQNLDTVSLVAPSKPFLESLVQTQGHSTVDYFLAQCVYTAAMATRVWELDIDMKKPQYDTWKKPLLNRIFLRDDGSRFTEEGEFNPVWGLGVSNIHTKADFAMSTMARRLEEWRRNRGTQSA